MTVKIYVEGGGDHNHALQIDCRRGFSEFLRKSGLEGRMPRVVACGGRSRAYEKFRIAHEEKGPDDLPILLVDSEGTVIGRDSWEHVSLHVGDEWERPPGATVDQIHLMVQAMEAWFYADKEELEKYYGQGFRLSALSQRLDVENIPKDDLFAGLRRATRDCKKGE